MKEATDISKPTNLVYHEVIRKLENRKTSVFIVVVLINIFVLGLLLADYRQLERNYENLNDSHGVTQVMINKLKVECNE